MRPDQKRDYFSGALFLVITMVALVVIIPSGVTVPSTVKIAALSPDFWPRVIVAIAGLAALFLIFETWKMPAPLEEDEAEDTARYSIDTLPAVLRAVVLVVALFLFYASLTTLGVVVASIILMFAMMLFFGEKKVVLIAVLSIGIPIILYLFFRYIASVPIPLGIFGN